MRTRSSSNLPVVSPSNPSTSNPKCRNRRRSKQPFILEESPIDTMDDQRTMAELLRTPTEGYEEAIVVPLILAEQFELKHSLFNMMTSDQFFRLEKDNPHDHIRWFNKITSTIKYKDVPNSAIKLMLFPFSLAEAACRTTNLRNEISNFQQRFDESFHEAWDRYKDLLRACPHHGFTELYQLDTFYNALNLTDQDTLNATAGGNMLERRTQDVLTIIENKSKVRNSRNKLVVSQVKSFDAISNSSSEIAKLTHAVNQQTSVVTTVMTAILKQFQATPPPASVKAVKEICVTCGGAHPYYQCLATSGSRPLPSNIVANPKGELKTITTQSAVILKKLLEKLGDPGKLLIPYGFSKLKCKALADLAGIARDVFVPISKFTFLADFVIVDYESDPRVPLILGRPVLLTAHALIDVHGKEMILRDGDERLTLNMRHDTSSYSNQSQKESINLINVFNNSSEDFLKDLFSTNQPSDNHTFPSHPELTVPEVKNDIFDLEGVLSEDFSRVDALPSTNNEDKVTDMIKRDKIQAKPDKTEHKTESVEKSTVKSQQKVKPDKIKAKETKKSKGNKPRWDYDPRKLLCCSGFTEMNSILKDSIDESNLADPNDNLVDTIPEMFTDEHTLDYSSPLLYDEYDDDLFEFESDNNDAYNDPFDSKKEKINESKLLIDELDLPKSSDFLPSLEYDSFLFEDFFEVDALPSTNNEDKVFNPGILIQENLFQDTVQVKPDKNVKKIAISHAFLILEDFNPPLSDHELSFHKEVPGSKTSLLFSSKNEEKVFKPEILTSKGVHTFLLLELSHRGPKAFKVIKILESPMKIFPCSYGEDIRILDIPCLHFYPS
nr:hypothetical protein [Tanacetum cinerariifolium]